MELVKVKVSEIIPYKHNPRKNDAAAIEVAESIRECGYCNPIIVDEKKVILAGHTRLKALKILGRDECEIIIRRGLTAEQKKKYRLYDNKTAEFADWDYDKLFEEMEGLDFSAFDISWDRSGETVEYGDSEFAGRTCGDERLSGDEFDYECPECGFMFNA